MSATFHERRAKTRSLILLLVVLGVFSACSSSGGSDGSATSSTEGSSSTRATLDDTTTAPTTAANEEAAVEDAYRGYWTAVVAASDPPDPDHPDLARYAVDPALATARDSIGDLHGSNLTQRGSIDPAPVIESIDGDRATVSDCLLDGGVTYSPTGAVVVAAKTAPVSIHAVVLRSEGGWKVAELEIGGTCER